MANYAIFDEKYYLSQYPWLKPAIDAGVIKSGKEHFEKFGQDGALTRVSRYFDKDTYLEKNPDLKPFIYTRNNPSAPFASSLDHFIQYGYEQGRNQVSPEYSEDFYLANNSELRSFVGPNAPFKSGYQHFIQFGVKEGRFGTSFFEPEYLKKNPDIVPFVNSGNLKTGREHYFNFGKNEPSRSATFVGTSSSDILTGIGVGNTELIGVEVGIDSQGNRQYESFGINEFDVLIGSPGVDTFVLGIPATTGNAASITLYTGLPAGTPALNLNTTGPGFATIQKFNAEDDLIQLAGNSLSEGYTLIISGNNLLITRYADLMGVIEGGANLNLVFQQSNGNGTFLIG
ncbi:MAG: calcium-binding protein [Microcoleus sp. PH2017_40_RAT_O_B]|uniref:calcium-binding protein n=1 Tax=unclassified Microcoleus TaxID=2642155 RepID=UPI001E13DB6D|nr:MULTISPECIES: calcium-binding protein [unclassified Microcoleus]MCC3574663.1 calcium-binding protein [Microcoleus sp. PH2017_34_RAT_O_A]MCC3612321.1 calcium-binding protein [Microcoleus sp. PH2017_40_RAT_O_B]